MRHDANRRMVLVALLAWVTSGTGCAGYRPTQSGYLSDYSQLQKDPFHLNYGLGLQRAMSHNASADSVSVIDSYYIEPVAWMVDESSRAGGDPKRRENLILALDEALRDQLGKLKPIVDQPGPNTARVKAAITSVHLSRPWANLALTATFATPFWIGPVFNGGALIEAEVLGPDGRQISAVSVASGGGMIDIIGYYTRGGHARQAMNRAAWELRETLETK